MRSFNENGRDNNEHANKSKTRSTREFVDVAVEGEWVRYTDCAESDDELAVCEDEKDGYILKIRKYRADDVGYCVAYGWGKQWHTMLRD